MRPVAAWAVVLLASLALRFAMIPWDLGGFVFQVILGVIGIVWFGWIHPRLAGPARSSSMATILPIGAFVCLGTVWFAPQALLPFVFVAVVLGGVFLLWSGAKARPAFAASLLLLPLIVYCFYGVARMGDVLGLRYAAPDDVTELRFAPAAGEGNEVVVDSPERIGAIVAALGETSPYSPIREGIVRPWRMTVVSREGERRTVSLGDGNRRDAACVWIEMTGTVYQNPRLRDALREAGITPW